MWCRSNIPSRNDSRIKDRRSNTPIRWFSQTSSELNQLTAHIAVERENRMIKIVTVELHERVFVAQTTDFSAEKRRITSCTQVSRITVCSDLRIETCNLPKWNWREPRCVLKLVSLLLEQLDWSSMKRRRRRRRRRLRRRRRWPTELMPSEV
jgi:hypothetical protein